MTKTTNDDIAEQFGLPRGDVQKAIQSLVGPIESLHVVVQAARSPMISYMGLDGDELAKLNRVAIILQIALSLTQQQIGALSSKIGDKNDK